MSDSFTTTEVTEAKGCFGQLMDSIKGVAAGGMIFVVAFGALFFNECRSADRFRVLEEGKGAVVEIKSDKVDKGNEGKLVHTTGDIKVKTALSDPDFGVEAKGTKLERSVEMYQWKENKKTKTKKEGGKEVKTTTYSYEKVWSDSAIKSSNFNKNKKSKGKINPGEIPFEGKTVFAKDAKVGAFDIPEALLKQVSSAKDFKVTDAMLAKATEKGFKVDAGKFFKGADASSPSVGDIRIKYAVANPKEITVVGMQKGSTFAAKKMSDGDLFEAKSKKMTSAEIFGALEDENTMLTWMLRIGGFLFMFMGLTLIFKPLAVIADKIPLIGGMLETGLFLFTGVMAFVISMGTIAAGWIVARPLLGGILCIISLGALGGLAFLGYTVAKKKKAA